MSAIYPTFNPGEKYWGIVCNQCEAFIPCMLGPENARIPDMVMDTTCKACGFVSKGTHKDLKYRVYNR